MNEPRRRGRPRKVRPKLGDPLVPGMSQRDIAAAMGCTRRYLARALDFASLPEDHFNELLAVGASKGEIRFVARSRAGKTAQRVRRCPCCGYVLWVERGV